MDEAFRPLDLRLKRDDALEIDWADGRRSRYTISLLRTMCPCALCRTVRESKSAAPAVSASPAPTGEGLPKPRRASLSVLPGNFAEAITAKSAELVGGYALRIEWSDDHGSGIYSFRYLREIDPAP